MTPPSSLSLSSLQSPPALDLTAKLNPVVASPQTAEPGLPPLEGTARAYLIGMALAAIFAACNVYLGLKLGLIANLSIPATLFAFAAVQSAGVATNGAVRRFSILENNLVQAAASAGGSVAAAGLVSSVPVMMILGVTKFSVLSLTLWIIVVSAVGISIAMFIRRPLIESENLPFAPGVACATTLRQLHGAARDGARQSAVLIAVIFVAIGVAWLTQRATAIAPPPAGPYYLKPIDLPFLLAGVAAAKFGWALSFEPLAYAIGGLIGPRVALSLLLGALIAHGAIAPSLFAGGFTESPARSEWLSWPGSTLLIVGTLVPLLSSFGVFRRSFAGLTRSASAAPDTRIIQFCIVLAAVLALAFQIVWFHVPPVLALLGTALALPLAIIAGRVAGEVSITPSGPIAKLSLLAVGLTPASTTQASLLSANLAGGAASQCADLLHDLKCGAILGASWRRQALSQMLGASVGALAGAALLLWRFPDPSVLLSPSSGFFAPAIKPLLAITDLLAKGGAAIPASAWPAVEFAAAAALALLAIEAWLPPRVRSFLPSPVSVGFAFLLSPATSVSIAIGALVVTAIRAARPPASRPAAAATLIVACTGIVIGALLFEIAYDAFHAVR